MLRSCLLVQVLLNSVRKMEAQMHRVFHPSPRNPGYDHYPISTSPVVYLSNFQCHVNQHGLMGGAKYQIVRCDSTHEEKWSASKAGRRESCHSLWSAVRLGIIGILHRVRIKWISGMNPAPPDLAIIWAVTTSWVDIEWGQGPTLSKRKAFP